MFMKTIAHLSLLLMGAVLAGGLASCSQEQPSRDVEDPTPQVLDPSLGGMTFTFRLPGGDAQVVDPRAIHDAPEWDLQKLWLYEFDAEGKLLFAPKDIKADLSQADPTQPTYVYKIANLSGGSVERRQFYFVANLNTAPGAAGDKLADVQKKVLAAKMSTKSADVLMSTKDAVLPNGTDKADYRIPMTGLAKHMGSSIIHYLPNTSAEVTLVRVVARIDILNYIPDFKITKISLEGAFDSSYLDTQTVNDKIAAPAGAARVSGIEPFASLNGGLSGNRANPGTLAKAFYLYEGENTAKDCVAVRIEATFHGAGRVYLIPFKTKDAQGNFTQPVPVKRNHLYKISIGDKEGESNEVSFQIDDEDWNFHELVHVFE